MSGEPPDPTGRPRPSSGLVACTGIAALGLCTFAQLRPTNFRGYDEWLVFWMLARGLSSFPYANRPLGLAWHWPAWLLAPDSLWGFLLVHGLWLTASGVLTFALLRRLVGRGMVFAFLAGALAVVWMPSEQTRIATVQMIQYSGPTTGALLATWLLAEAWQRGSRTLALASAVPAALAALSHEATLPILATAPVLVAVAGGARGLRTRLRWAALASAVPAALAARALLPLLGARDQLGYQIGSAGALRPLAGVLRQLGVQLRHQLEPALSAPVAGLATPGVAVAVLVFLAGLLGTTRAEAAPLSVPPPRRAVLVAGLLGLLYAVLGYLPFVVARGVRGPVRTEFLSAPGTAVLLAAALTLAASLAPNRARLVLTALLGSWLVAVGTSHTLQLQRTWGRSIYLHQRATLRQIGALAPDLEPHTLVVLLQSGHTWMFDFTFSKAIEYLYGDAARGWVPGADPYLQETQLEPDAVVSVPAAVVRGPWRVAVARFRYDETVVFSEDEQGRIALRRTWPGELGALPPGASYRPTARIRAERPEPTRLAIVDPDP
jgi:hypothetical protein